MMPSQSTAFLFHPGSLPVRETLARFAARELAAFRDTPMRKVGPADLARLATHARQLGLLAQDSQSGLLWAAQISADDLSDALHALQVVGACHGGIAFHFHQQGQARFLTERLGIVATENQVVWLPGTHRLGDPVLRDGLGSARASGDAVLPATDDRLSWLAGASLASVWIPVPRAEGFGWANFSPAQLQAGPVQTLHGLEGIFLQGGLMPLAEGEGVASVDGLLAELLALNALGAMAIALGTVRHAHALAFAQVNLRQQGGKYIRDHDAVQSLLAQLCVAIDTTQALLDTVVALPATVAELARLFGYRLVVHEQLCNGANAAMQIFGGSGYMQDMGLERIVRDNNLLRLVGGTPDDLRRFIACAGLDDFAEIHSGVASA